MPAHISAATNVALVVGRSQYLRCSMQTCRCCYAVRVKGAVQLGQGCCSQEVRWLYTDNCWKYCKLRTEMLCCMSSYALKMKCSQLEDTVCTILHCKVGQPHLISYPQHLIYCSHISCNSQVALLARDDLQELLAACVLGMLLSVLICQPAMAKASVSNS